MKDGVVAPACQCIGKSTADSTVPITEKIRQRRRRNSRKAHPSSPAAAI